MKKSKSSAAPSKKPRPKIKKSTRFENFGKRYPSIAEAYNALGSAAHNAGPLDGKTRALVKLALSIGAWREGAVHSHTRRALDEGCSPEEIRHTVLLAITTLGFPSTMAAMSWVENMLTPS